MKELPFKPQAMIFDLDGTLLDTEPLYSEAAQAVLAPYGYVFSRELKRRIIGGDSLKGAKMTVEEYDLPISAEEFLTRRKIHLDKLFPKAAEIEGAGEFLTYISKKGVALGLATSSHMLHCDMKIGHRTWRPLLRTVVCGDDPELKRSKPEPDIFLLCAARMSVEPAETIAFEDSKNGVLAAKAAGMTVIAISSPYIGPGDLDQADIVVDNFRELM